MSRDYRALLSDDACWDQDTQDVFERRGEALQDRILQSREELIALCELIEEKGIRSYLEVGAWTGRLVSALHRIFRFDLVAACDDGWAEQHGLSLSVPTDARFFRGDSGSPEYERWREALGPVDLVLIDANHSWRAVRRDFEINRRHPHRFLAFHDIVGAHRQTAGVRRFWRELAVGNRREIIRPHAELGLSESTMGIGLWSQSEQP